MSLVDKQPPLVLPLNGAAAPWRGLEDILRLRDRLNRVSSGSSLTLSGMASGLLRQEQDAGNNESQQNTGGTVAAERKAAMINWLVEQIAQGGTERAREDKSGPEKESPRNVRKEISGGYQREPCAEYEGTTFIAEPVCVGHPVAERRSQGLGEQDRSPIEHLDLRRSDGLHRNGARRFIPYTERYHQKNE